MPGAKCSFVLALAAPQQARQAQCTCRTSLSCISCSCVGPDLRAPKGGSPRELKAQQELSIRTSSGPFCNLHCLEPPDVRLGAHCLWAVVQSSCRYAMEAPEPAAVNGAAPGKLQVATLSSAGRVHMHTVCICRITSLGCYACAFTARSSTVVGHRMQGSICGPPSHA